MKYTPNPMISKGPHERRRIGSLEWARVAIASWLWPKELLYKLEAGEIVVFNDYEWRKFYLSPEESVL